MNKFSEDDFFDMLTRSQSKRMDDQRCSLKVMAAAGITIAPNAKVTLRKPLQQQNSNPISPSTTTGIKTKENR